MLAVSAALTALTTLLLLGVTAANLAGQPAGAWDGAMLSAIVGETEFGRVWTARMMASVLLVATAGFVFMSRWRTALSVASVALALGLLASLALVGHAAVEGGAGGWAHRVADAAHLVGAGVWLGALPPLMFLLRAAGSGGRAGARFAVDRLTAFHSVGLAAVLVLAATGLANSWFLVGSPTNLVSTPYGLLLSAKVGLFVIMVGFAAHNRFRLVPTLSSVVGDSHEAGAAARRVHASVRAEWLLGLALLVIVAILGAIEPARGGDDVGG